MLLPEPPKEITDLIAKDEPKEIKPIWEKASPKLRREIINAALFSAPKIRAFLKKVGAGGYSAGAWLGDALEECILWEDGQNPKTVLELKSWSPAEASLAAPQVGRLRNPEAPWRDNAEKTLETLKKLGADNGRVAEGDLELAAEENDGPRIKEAIALGARAKSPSGSRAMVRAARHQEPEALRALIEAGAWARGAAGRDAIGCAFHAEPRAGKAIDVLRAAGADTEVIGRLRLIEACSGKDPAMVTFSASLAKKVSLGDLNRAMREACKTGLPATVRFLAEHGAEIGGGPVLHPVDVAASWGRKDIIETLIDLGADPRGRDFSPLFHAKMNNHKRLFDWLVEITQPNKETMKIIEGIPWGIAKPKEL